MPYNKVQANTGGADYYVLAKTCPNPEKAMSFMEWLLTGDRAMRFYSAVPGHLLPILKSQGEEFLSYEPENPVAATYVSEHKDWLEVIFDEAAPYAIAFDHMEGAIQGNQVVPTNLTLTPELAERMYSESNGESMNWKIL